MATAYNGTEIITAACVKKYMRARSKLRGGQGGRKRKLGLSHRLEVGSDVEVASGGLDDVVDGKAVADFGQRHAGVLVDLEDPLKI